MVVTPNVVPPKNTRVFELKFTPVTFTVVVAEPAITAAGVSELNAATAGGFSSVN